MNRVIFLYLLLFLPAIFLLSGCFGAKELHLSLQDSGRTFEVKSGSFVTVSLPGNPTTGYQWKFASPFDPVLLGLCRDSFLAAPEKEKLGAGGYRYLKFEVLAPGKAALDLKYVRPWEHNGEVKDRFQVILYCVGKPKSQWDSKGEEFAPSPRRDQFGNDIRRKEY